MQFLWQERPLVKSVPQCTSYSTNCKETEAATPHSTVATAKDSKVTKIHHLDASVDEYNSILNGAYLIMEIYTSAVRSIISGSGVARPTWALAWASAHLALASEIDDDHMINLYSLQSMA